MNSHPCCSTFSHAFSALLATATVAALATPLAFPPSACAQTPPTLSFQITDMPLLSTSRDSQASSLNNVGQIVGGTMTAASKTYYAWIWTPGRSATTTSLATPAKIEALPSVSKSFTRSWAADVNDTGQVAGKIYLNDYSSTANCLATLWLPGKLGTPVDCTDAATRAGLLPGWVLREARALSNSDAGGNYYVVGIGDYTDPSTRVVTLRRGLVWTMRNDIMVSAAVLACPDADPTYASINPRDVNNLGQVAGDYDPNWRTPDVTRTPHIWSAADGTIKENILMTGATDAYAINDAGTIVGFSYGSSSAFLSAAPYTTVDTLTPGQGTRAFGLNNRNQIVGEYVSGYYLPCLWQVQVDSASGQPLRDSVTGALLYDFYDLSRCRIIGTTVLRSLYSAQAINDNGWILGHGKTSSVERDFLLVPTK